MNTQRFDNLARTMVLPAGSRRAALRLLAGTALGVGFARLGMRQASAACRRVGKTCRRSGQCCPGARCDVRRAPGKCKCKAGFKDCTGDKLCENLRIDNAHCGACGTLCGGGSSCREGACECPSGQTDCQGKCLDLRHDPNHCGTCTTACGVGQECCGGLCLTACDPNQCLICDADGQLCVVGIHLCDGTCCPPDLGLECCLDPSGTGRTCKPRGC